MADTIFLKPCSLCKQELPFTDFYKDKNKKLGITSECAKCRRAKDLRPRKMGRNAKRFDLTGEHLIESLPERDLAYIAGLFDGEGSIHIAKGYYGLRSDRPNSKQAGTTYGIRCTVGMTDKSVIYWLKEATGLGSIYHRKQPSSENSKPAWYWKTSDGESIIFLSIISDYLKIKHPQAALALELARIKTFSRKGRRHMPERQLEIVNEIGKLNHRGVVASPEKEKDYA